MSKPTRQRKSPQQRAQEALGVATRAVERLATTQERLEAELQAVSAELTVAVRRRDFLAQHPDLGDDAPSSVASVPSTPDVTYVMNGDDQ